MTGVRDEFMLEIIGEGHELWLVRQVKESGVCFGLNKQQEEGAVFCFLIQVEARSSFS
jgi:hypothetical protein